MRLIAGLDVGTTGCKVTVFTAEGENLGREYRDYPVRRAVAAQEVDAVALAESVRDCVRAAKSRFGRIEAMGVASFGEAFVLTDAKGTPLRPILLCTDARGADECRAFCESFGAERAARIAGARPSESYSFPKLMWIRAHEPEVYARTRHVMLVEDYVVFLLTGRRVIDFSLAARTGGFDIRNFRWSGEILSAAGLDAGLFSTALPTGAVAGADADGMKVVLGGHDQVACAVGAGVFEPGIAAEGAGTVECLTPVFAKIPETTHFQDDNYCVVPYFGNYVSYAYSYTGGELLRWCKETLCRRDHAELQSGDYAGPTGLLVLPHFAGAATPYMDSGSRGAIVGLSLATTDRDIYLACMEAVAYEMRLNRDRLAACGVTFGRLVATGGGAKSKLWMQMKADVLGVPIDTLETEDAGTVGSAMMAGVAAGVFADLSAARAAMVRKTGSFVPTARRAGYDAVYGRYEKLYRAVRPLLRSSLALVFAFGLTSCRPTAAPQPGGRLRIDIAPCANALAVAREKVRSATACGLASNGVEVVFAPGAYDVTDTAVFGPDDSGSPQAKVVYRAARPRTVTFSGGPSLEASAFGPVTDEKVLARLPPKARGRARVADMSKTLPLLSPWPDRVGIPPGPWLYAHGQPLELARWPDKTCDRGNWARFATPCETGVPPGHRKGNYSPKMAPGSFYCPDARADRWEAASGVWLFGYWTHDWAYDILRVASVTTTATNRIVSLAAPHGYGIAAGTWGAKERRYYAVNLLEELDAEGEWWLDRAARQLYLIPPPGFPEADLHLAVLDKPFVILEDVHDVEFLGLRFVYSHCEETAFDLRGACENVVLDGCDIRCVAGSGVQLSGRRNVFRNGSVLQVGGAGVRIVGGDRMTLARADNLVADSEIAFYGRFVRTYAAGIDLQGVGQTVRGCRIHDAPHNAIFYGGNDNLIQSNEVYRVLLETGDAGAIYTGRDTSTLGNVIEGNHLHDLGGDEELMPCTMGIYFDDCDWGDAVCNNVFERLGTAVFIGGGNLHPVVGNTMRDCAVGVHMDARGITWQKTKGGFRPNAQGESWQYGKLKPFGPFAGAWRTRYPELKALLADRPELPRQNPVSNNVFVACRHAFSLDSLSQSVTNECPFADNRILEK